MTWRLAIDIGGTFTDVVALDEDDGTVHLAKVPSTPQDPADGFLKGIEFMTAEKKYRRLTYARSFMELLSLRTRSWSENIPS